MNKFFARWSLRVWGYLLKRSLRPEQIREWHLSQLEMSDATFRQLREVYLKLKIHKAEVALLQAATRRRRIIKNDASSVESESKKTFAAS